MADDKQQSHHKVRACSAERITGWREQRLQSRLCLLKSVQVEERGLALPNPGLLCKLETMVFICCCCYCLFFFFFLFFSFYGPACNSNLLGDKKKKRFWKTKFLWSAGQQFTSWVLRVGCMVRNSRLTVFLLRYFPLSFLIRGMKSFLYRTLFSLLISSKRKKIKKIKN